MVTDKARVASYLDDNEKGALDSFCKDNGYSASEGVAHLVRNYLIENDDGVTRESRFAMLEATQNFLVDWRIGYVSKIDTHCLKVEKLEEMIAELQEKVFSVSPWKPKEEFEYFSDPEIAAVVSKPVELVKLWRMGHQKPKGKRILEKLEPYCLRDGSWVRKKGKASLESVGQNV